MIIKTLKITNFRNFSQAELNFSPVILLLGKNAQGKSNFLEAIYFLATTKSLRAERDPQLIKQGESFCRVEGEIEENPEAGDLTRLEITMLIRPEMPQMAEKRVKVNGVPRRAIDYIGNLAVVQFSPEDINLVTGSPSLRRLYLDLTLSQADGEYKTALSKYSEALSARNKLLKNIKEGRSKISELDFWTNQVLEWGVVLSEKRRRFFQAINKISGQFRFSYDESVISEARIKQYLMKEVEAAVTLIGPHRDDFIFELNGHNLAYFGSRGEQRTAVLELKLAELQFITEVKGSKPVLLLDDIFSELDRQHQEYVISIISGQQTILSAVETEQIPQDFLKSIKVIKVEEGKLI